VKQKSTGKIFAMKVLNKKTIIERNEVDHTKAEKSILMKLSSPFLVRLYYSFQTHDKLYFVMDYINGGFSFPSFLARLGCFLPHSPQGNYSTTSKKRRSSPKKEFVFIQQRSSWVLSTYTSKASSTGRPFSTTTSFNGPRKLTTNEKGPEARELASYERRTHLHDRLWYLQRRFCVQGSQDSHLLWHTRISGYVQQ